jgi:hypothetical protein
MSVMQVDVDVQLLGATQHGPEIVQDPPGRPKLCSVHTARR